MSWCIIKIVKEEQKQRRTKETKMYVIMSKYKEYVVKLEEIRVNECRIPQVTKNINKAYIFDNRDYAKGCLELSGLGYLGYKVVKVNNE